MKSVIVTVATLIIHVACHAQVDTIFNQKDANGLRQGFWKVQMKENGSTYLYAIVSYKDDNRDGLCIYFYPNGNKRSENNFKAGVLHGLTKVYRVYGTLQYEEEYNAGKIHGIKKFYNTDGKLVEEQEYKDGMKTGIYRRYSKSGRLVAESFFIDGIENGIRKIYSDDEKHELTREFDFKNGVRIAARSYKKGKLNKEEKFNYEEELRKNEELKKRNKSID
jgi:antitoxin component YwqK of YwqJK toxin-antitoxin module